MATLNYIKKLFSHNKYGINHKYFFVQIQKFNNFDVLKQTIYNKETNRLKNSTFKNTQKIKSD